MGIAASSVLVLRLLGLCEFWLKLVVIFGLFFLALSPILELYLVKLLADFIIGVTEEMAHEDKIFAVVKIFGLLVIVYALRYLVKIGRISFVNHLMNLLSGSSGAPSPWLRAALIEQTQIFSMFIQLATMGSVCLYMAPWLGASFIIVLCLFYFFTNWLFLKQVKVQRRFRFNKITSSHELGSKKIFERVRAQELSSAFGSFTAALLFFSLLVMIAFNSIEPVTALVGLFLVRLYNITLGMFAGSVMRMARALAYVDSSALPGRSKEKVNS